MRILRWWQWALVILAAYLAYDLFAHGGPARRLSEWGQIFEDLFRMRR